MPSEPKFESPVVRHYPTGKSGDLTLADCSATTKWLLRSSSDGPVANQLQAPFGSSRQNPAGIVVLGSRPGEWILLGPQTAVVDMVDGLLTLDPSQFATAVDWTHCQALFRVTGNDAPRVLQKLCSLDWSDRMTPNGAVVSATVAKVNCDIARQDSQGLPAYLLLCDRSYGQYLFEALVEAGAEFGLTVKPHTGRNCPSRATT